MKQNKFVQSKFDKYIINSLWIENYDKLDEIFEKNYAKKLNEWISYVNFVDSILNNMSKESSKLLRNVYIEKKDKKSLHFSESNFYWKHRKAIEEFIKYFGK